MASTPPRSVNFGFLLTHDPLLVALGAQAERYFTEDPSTCLLKLRQFSEVLAQEAAASVGTLPRSRASSTSFEPLMPEVC